jgi:hypothetical protein
MTLCSKQEHHYPWALDPSVVWEPFLFSLLSVVIHFSFLCRAVEVNHVQQLL